jgi:drug/metabolite transporter (DMT)-like permease
MAARSDRGGRSRAPLPECVVVTQRHWILVGVVAALWGSSYMFIKVALEDVSPAFLVFARCALGALVLVPFALRAGAFAAVRRHPVAVLVIAVTQMLAPFLLISVGEQHVPSSLAGILVASAPIFTALIAVAVVHSERLPTAGLAGIAIGIVGIALLFGVDLGGHSDELLGGLAILLAGLGYAVGSILAKLHLGDVPPVGVATTITGLSALALLPVAPSGAPSEIPGVDTLAALLVLGAGSTGLAFLVFYMLNAEIGPGRASIVAYISPVFSVFYGVVLLDEGFTAGTALGLVLILAGSWMVAEGRVPWRRRSLVATRT